MSFKEYIREQEEYLYHATVYALNTTTDDQLDIVMNYMKQHGRPTIRVYIDGNYIRALEGSHRLIASKRLDIIPILQKMDIDDSVEDFIDIDREEMLDSMVDYNDDDFDENRERTVEDVLSYMDNKGIPIKFPIVEILD